MLPSDVRGLHEAYNNIYAPKFETILDEMSDEHVNELTDDLIEEVIEELFYECLEEGYDIDDVELVLVESLENSIIALNEAVLMELNPYAPAGSKESGEYNKATTKSKRSAENAAKRVETIEKVKGAVKKVGSEIRRRGANAAVSAYAAGKMAKDATKKAGKAAVTAAGEVAGKAVKYAKGAKKAFSAGYNKGSEEESDSGEESKDSPKAFPASRKKSETDSEESGEETNKKSGSLRAAAGNLLKKGIKKAVGLGARAVAGTARGVHKVADKVAKRLGEETITEDPVQDFRDMKRAKENASGVRGPELSHSANSSGGSAAQKPKPRSREFERVLPQPRSREFSHGNQGGSRPLKSVLKGGLTMSYEPEGKSVEEGLLDVGRSAAQTVGGMVGRTQGQKTGIPGGGIIGDIRGRQKGGQMYDKAIEPLKGRIPGFNKGGTVKAEQVSFEIGSGDPNAARKQQKINKDADAGVANAAAKAKGPLLPSSMVKLANSYEPEDIYDLVIEYLLDTEQAESISEAHYIISQLDVDMIVNIVEETTTEKLARRASEKADEPGAKTEYKPEGPGFKNPRSRSAIMNQIAGRAKNRSQNGVDSQYASQSEQPRRGGRKGRGSKTDRPSTANMPNPNRKPKG